MAVGDNNEQQNDRQNEQQNQINQNEQQNELNQNINNENEQQQEEVKENPEADQEGHTPGGPEEEKPKAEGPAAEENDREFDLDKLRTDPELWKRICMPLDDEGHMGNVFNGKENPFQKDSAAAMSKVQGLAANGQLYLRGRGTSEFQKVERSEEGTGYKLGDSFEKTENAPYDPVLGTLIRLSNAYFKGIFGRDWFSKAAEKYNNYRAMKAARESEQEAIEEALLRAQEKEEAEKRKQEEEKERAEKEREKAAKEKEKANKKARRFEKKQKEAAEKRRKEVEERERRKEEQREGAEGKKQGENERDREVDPNAIAPQQQEKDASIQAPNQLIEEQKKQFKERLKEENEAWKGTADWKVRTGEKLFHGEGNPELREEYDRVLADGTIVEQQEFLMGCFMGIVSNSAGKKGPEHKGLMDDLLKGNKPLGNEFEQQLKEGVADYKNAKAAMENNDKGPMAKLLKDTMNELAKSASNCTELSERHKIICDYMGEIKNFAKNNNINLEFSPHEMTAINGALALGRIAAQGKIAHQALGKDTNIDLSNARTAGLMEDYLLMKSVNAGLKHGPRGGDISHIQQILGTGDYAKDMRAATHQSKSVQDLIKDPKGAEKLGNLLLNPDSVEADKLGRNLLGENSLSIAQKKSGELDRRLEMEKQQRQMEEEQQRQQQQQAVMGGV